MLWIRRLGLPDRICDVLCVLFGSVGILVMFEELFLFGIEVVGFGYEKCLIFVILLMWG